MLRDIQMTVYRKWFLQPISIYLDLFHRMSYHSTELSGTPLVDPGKSNAFGQICFYVGSGNLVRLQHGELARASPVVIPKKAVSLSLRLTHQIQRMVHYRLTSRERKIKDRDIGVRLVINGRPRSYENIRQRFSKTQRPIHT